MSNNANPFTPFLFVCENCLTSGRYRSAGVTVPVSGRLPCNECKQLTPATATRVKRVLFTGSFGTDTRKVFVA